VLRPKFVGAVAAAWLLGLSACEEPPPKHVDRVDPPVLERDRAASEAFRRKAHEDALTAALPLALAALQAGDPLGAWQTGRAPAAIPVLTIGQQLAVAERVEAAQVVLAEIDDSHLQPSSVVIFRAVQFGITRLEEEIERRPPHRQDPTVALHAVERVLDELVYRLLQDDCDDSCAALPGELATALAESRTQLGAASTAATRRGGLMAAALAQRCRELATRPLLERHASLQAGLEQLASTLDEQQGWLAELGITLAAAKSERAWTEKPSPIGPRASVERLPDVLGVQALSRRMAAEDLLILDPERDVTRVAEHVRRWDTLRRELVGEAVPNDAPAQLDVPRCEAALARIRAGLAMLEGVEAPQLSCERYVELLGGRELEEGALVLELLDYGVIEPQRRTLRKRELPEIALVSGEQSASVHTHLRRVMLLARLDEPAARARAIAAGSRALCLAEASLWVHAELGIPSAVADAIGQKCAALGETAAILDEVLGDPRGALTGYGLSLIGDEPARMVGFDRFWWAPLGLMQTLATPPNMHPDQFTLPDDAALSPEKPALDVKVERLSPGEAP
jgi:hypothetical protein